jgi:hypothetical protein
MMTMTSEAINGEPQNDIDRVLRGFFRAEMPDPWPSARALQLAPARPGLTAKRAWFRNYGRLALAASIFLMLLGYLALAGNFPQDGGTGSTIDQNNTIAERPGWTTHRVPTRSGREAVRQEKTIPGGPAEGPTIIINVQELKAPNARR